jgi:hypothetical protein
MILRNIWVTLALTGLLAGCSAVDTRPTVEQLDNARVAVEAAEKADAKSHAPEEWRQSQDALMIARDAYANKVYDRALPFAKKATIYARVAKAKAEQKAAENRLNGAKEQLAATESKIQAFSQPVAAPPQPLGTTAPPGKMKP